MRINIPIILAIACLSISLAFIIITFILENWLLVKENNNRYGMWRACRSNSTVCYTWYVDGIAELNFPMTDSYKAFQALQSCMLGLIVVTLVSLLFNIKICSKLLTIFIIDAILIFLAICCGFVSLIVYGINVHDPKFYILDWCFWLSVAALCLIFIGLIFLVGFTATLKKAKADDSLSTQLVLTPRDSSRKYLDQSNTETKNPQPNGNINQNPKHSEIKQEENKNSPRFISNNKNNIQTPNNYRRDQNNIINGNKSSSPRFQKHTPNQSESRLKTRIENKSSDDDNNRSNRNSDDKSSRRPNRNYWTNKSKGHKGHRYHHEHYVEKRPSQEQYRAGYSSEPDMIEYSLDRSWVSASNNLNTSMPILDNETPGLTGTFNSRHFVKLPKLIFYDGSNHYTRANIKI